MKNKQSNTRDILNLTRIEVFHTLTENYGSDQLMQSKASNEQKMNFQLDRLFSIFHHN